tara:strand:+ start:864 stop:1094 length:231 start_codon:yes stop_codon:yes gene_type:complete
MSSLIEMRDECNAELKKLADAYTAKTDQINLVNQERSEIAAQFEQQKGSLRTLNTLIAKEESSGDSEACSVEAQVN